MLDFIDSCDSGLLHEADALLMESLAKTIRRRIAEGKPQPEETQP
jgi:hypothetical protein